MADVADFGSSLGGTAHGKPEQRHEPYDRFAFLQDTARGIVLALVAAIDRPGRRRAVGFPLLVEIRQS